LRFEKNRSPIKSVLEHDFAIASKKSVPMKGMGEHDL
jgi:hypothetical protein